MATFDVHSHPDKSLRDRTPFLLDVQNSHLGGLTTRVVVPLRAASVYPFQMRDLNPSFKVSGMDVVMDTAAMAAFPASELRTPVDNLRPKADAIVSALDTLFGSH
jgi:toxin CcdB